ncbi:sugar nucleotide-binding protein [Zhongshania sp.]|uniref:sugar nucleotide-binding protein n=2 Tax=Zhongshania sp. TaxID=1971902 RepID=UPI003567CB9A
MNVIVISRPGALLTALLGQFASRGRATINVSFDELAGLGDDLLRGALVIDADALCYLQRNSGFVDAEHQRLLALREEFLARCRQWRVPYLLLSDGRVFGAVAEGGAELCESDMANASCVAGAQFAAVEQALLADVTQQGLVLRTGPLIAAQGGNFLGDCLATMRGDAALCLNDSRVVYPTPVADLARVVSGLVDQISCGAPTRGIYHYNSSGAATAYEFAEVVCAFASQFVVPMASLEVGEDGESWVPEVPALSCDLILQNFGIKRLPWRAYLPRMIKAVCEETSK